jgi:hypothetical protein
MPQKTNGQEVKSGGVGYNPSILVAEAEGS